MKTFSGPLLAVLTVLFVASFAVAQTIPPGTFKHIIIVVQENRTPDNLFGAGEAAAEAAWVAGIQSPCVLRANAFEPGVDILNGGRSVVDGEICNVAQPMNTSTLDPGHSYHDWFGDFNFGAMDGFCHTYNAVTKKITYAACPKTTPTPYSYVQASDVAPYLAVAKAYGFANYMFQTNEGPSFPAHQFLFTGTSAPVAPEDSLNYYLDFVADNTSQTGGFYTSGCPYSGGYGFPMWNLPDGSQEPDPRASPRECYPHDTLVTNTSGDRGVTWRYYTPTVSSESNPLGIIWDAPEGIPEVCYGQNLIGSGPCKGSEFTSHVVYPLENQYGFNYDSAPILDDIANCKLQQISWVIPDENWSDHPVSTLTLSPPYGPSWVGNIINAIGNSYQSNRCDYWGTHTDAGLSVEPTAIFVVWDDWGGWYDHVTPPEALEQNPQTGFTNCNPTSQWGCGYVYGFRVPLLVVSEYTQAGYVSGACTTCPNKTFPYVHDFGSLLRFTELNFGMTLIYPNTNYYADANAPDGADHNVPLSDFFNVNSPRTFTDIATPYPASTFRSYYTTPQNGVYLTPKGPDAISGEAD
jgi:phospholipase C